MGGIKFSFLRYVWTNLRYTARQGSDQLRAKSVEYIKSLVSATATSGLAFLFSLRHDFLSEWHRFISSNENFQATVKKEYFPYFVQSREIIIRKVELYRVETGELSLASLAIPSFQLGSEFKVVLAADNVLTREPDAQVFLLFEYTIG